MTYESRFSLAISCGWLDFSVCAGFVGPTHADVSRRSAGGY
jgi:hypothetical protein